MPRETRFDGLLDAVSKAGDDSSSDDLSASAENFWAQFESEEAEAVDRLNVDIPRSLHKRLKAACQKRGVSKKAVVTAMLQWLLDDV